MSNLRTRLSNRGAWWQQTTVRRVAMVLVIVVIGVGLNAVWNRAEARPFCSETEPCPTAPSLTQKYHANQIRHSYGRVELPRYVKRRIHRFYNNRVANDREYLASVRTTARVGGFRPWYRDLTRMRRDHDNDCGSAIPMNPTGFGWCMIGNKINDVLHPVTRETVPVVRMFGICAAVTGVVVGFKGGAALILGNVGTRACFFGSFLERFVPGD